jgi:hypothetical protein
MSKSNSISQEIVKEFFDYINGQLVWKKHSRFRRIGTPSECVGGDNYRVIWFQGKTYKAHRLIFLWHHGYLPSEVDHINRDRADNRIENLRAATRLENAKNRKTNANSTSGVTGVYWQKNANKWRAMIQINKRLVCLGLFVNLDDAIEARKKAAIKIYGSFLPL